MTRIMAKIGLRAIAIAAFGFAAVLVAAATPSAASSYTLNFTGTVTSAGGAFPPLGVFLGDSVSGSITYDPFETTGAAQPGGHVFDQTASTFTFHVSHPGVLDFTRTDSGFGRISSFGTAGSVTDLGMGAFGAVSHLILGFETGIGSAGPLTSAVGLPTTPDGLLALMGGPVQKVPGVYVFDSPGLGEIHFDIAFNPVVAATPIPATLPLLGAGLAMLGFVAWKRRPDRTTPRAAA